MEKKKPAPKSRLPRQRDTQRQAEASENDFIRQNQRCGGGVRIMRKKLRD